MNYGKKKASQKQKKITSKSAMQGKRVGVRLFKAFLLCLVVVAVIGVIGGGIFVKKIIADTPDVSPSDVKPKGFTTFVYADDGSPRLNVSYLLVQTVYISLLTRYLRICSMHL